MNVKVPPKFFPEATVFPTMEAKMGDDKEFFEEHWGKSVECPKCHGYGKWILSPDLMARCYQCNGFGIVPWKHRDAYCIHEFETEPVEVVKLPITFRCKKCGRLLEYTEDEPPEPKAKLKKLEDRKWHGIP